MRIQYSNAARCHRYGRGMMTIADARVHRVRTRGNPRSDSGVGGDVEVVVVVAAADAEAVVVEEVKHVWSASSSDEQLGRRMEATEGGRLDKGV